MNSAAIFVIGDEILHAEIEDENGPWLIRQLNDRGITVERYSILPDEPDVIAEELERFNHCDYRFATGGLGPTHDDRTLEGVARALDRSMVTDEELIELLREQHGTLNDAQRKMTLRPEGGEFAHIENSLGLAFKVENIYVFPGFPELLRPLFFQFESELEGTPLTTKTIEMDGLESDIAELLESFQNEYPELQFGSYPHTDGSITLKIRGRDATSVNAAHQRMLEEL